MSDSGSTSFEGLVHDTHAAVFGAAWRVLRNREDAEDVAQEVFLRVLDGRIDLERTREPSGVLAWVATRVALSRGRSDSARTDREVRRAMHAPDAPSDPHAVAADDEQRRLLYQALRELPEAQQAALVLRFQEGLTFAAVGRALGIAEPSAMERVRRGLEALERRLRRVGLAGLVPVVRDDGGRGLGALLASPPPAPRPTLVTELTRLAEAAPVASAAGATALAKGLFVPLLALVAVGVITVPLWLDAHAGAEETAAEVAASVAAPTGGDAEAGPGPTERGARTPARTAEVTGHAGPAVDPVVFAATDEHPARLRVRVKDADGAPVPEARVRAFVRVPGLKFPSENVGGETDGRGEVELRLPVEGLHEELRGRPWALLVDHPAAARVSTTVADLAPDEARAVDIVLDASAAEGAFELDVLVVDADGPVAGAEVSLGHVVGDVEDHRNCRRETEPVLTGPDGRVTLRGQWLGTKVLVVDARPVGRTLEREAFRVEESGVRKVRVSCDTGWVVRGRARVADDEAASLEGLELSLFPNAEGWRWPYLPGWWDAPPTATIASDGTFELIANPPDAGASLWLGIPGRAGGTWSPFALPVDGPTLHAVDELALVLKREDDPRDVGLHLAELHGHLELAESDERHWWPGRWVEVVRIPDGLASEAELAAFTSAALLGDADEARPRQQQGAQVLLAAPQTDVGPQTAEAQLELEQDPAHAFHHVGLAPGRVFLRADVRGHAPLLAGPFELRGEEVRADLRLSLDDGASWSGVVFGANGLPLSGALVTLTGPGARGEERLGRLDDWLREHPAAKSWGRLSARTDRFGRFTLAHVPRDAELLLAVAHPSHAPGILDVRDERDLASLRVALDRRR